MKHFEHPAVSKGAMPGIGKRIAEHMQKAMNEAGGEWTHVRIEEKIGNALEQATSQLDVLIQKMDADAAERFKDNPQALAAYHRGDVNYFSRLDAQDEMSRLAQVKPEEL